MSLSGSNANAGGCPEECVAIMNNVNVCRCSGNTPTNSTLIDGICPTSVVTTEPDWASNFLLSVEWGDSSNNIGFLCGEWINAC